MTEGRQRKKSKPALRRRSGKKRKTNGSKSKG